MLLYIVFVVAEIRNVLMHSDPRQAEPITIWDDIPQPADTDGLRLTYRQ
jgi:hypothetical protein